MKPFTIHQKMTGIILCLFFVFSLTGCSYFAKQIIYPARQPVVKNPGHYGMKYENIAFESLDGVALKGWLIPAKTEKLIIMTHPNGFTKYGYAAKSRIKPYKSDVEVEFLKTARVLNDAGYSVLMFDFRNHGESGRGSDGITGVGLNEYMDVVGAVKYIKSRPDLRDKRFGFVSFCMGANSTIIALSKAREELEDTKCLAAIQPISAELFITLYTEDTYGSLVAKILPSVEKECVKRGGYPLKEMSPLPYAKDIFVPTLVVQATGDKWTDIQFIKDLYSEIPVEKELIWLNSDMERFDTYNYFGDHPKKLLKFLGKYL